MYPQIDLGPVELNTFGLSLAFAFLCSGALAAQRFRELGRPVDWVYEFVLAAVIGGVVGAHVDWLIQNWEIASQNLLGSVFSGTGLVFFGGLAGGALAVGLWAKRRGYLGLELADAVAPAVAIGYAAGRIACQLSGDGDYGVPSTLPWAMAYPEGEVPTTVPVHPTPVYETVAMGLVVLLLWRLRDRLVPGTGNLFALYLVLAGVERFLVELIRRNQEVAAGLTLAQLISLAIVAAGVAWLARGVPRRAGGVGRAAEA
ncbi:MAG: prolipoprotein diacylglyceryl transferase [Thermoleophilaceae bacterium]|nr:prolipoprotein diacylglyceryl transferase [Thermoleophilaceae bacterium]